MDRSSVDGREMTPVGLHEFQRARRGNHWCLSPEGPTVPGRGGEGEGEGTTGGAVRGSGVDGSGEDRSPDPGGGWEETGVGRGGRESPTSDGVRDGVEGAVSVLVVGEYRGDRVG